MIHPYLPHTDEIRQVMLQKIGCHQIHDLFEDIPKSVILNGPLDLPSSMSEVELKAFFTDLAQQNTSPKLSFVGAGAYYHYIPSLIDHLANRSEFYTAYTPYQPEISQGILQAIFEYQTFIAELFGLPIANASLYDGASALAEAIIMTIRETQNTRILIPTTLNPFTKKVIQTYARNWGVELVNLPETNGLIDIPKLKAELKDGAAATVIQQPNFFGILEDLPQLITIIKAHQSIPICYVHPLSLGLLNSPGRLGAEIVVGEGQPLGLPVSYGGAYLGLIAVSERFLRKIPGRLVGETVDQNGNRAYVLTLQTREQHIRREKATSNICTNQSLCALRAAIYLSIIGPKGIKAIAQRCYNNAHYLFDSFCTIGLKPVYHSPFFMEFAIATPKPAGYYIERLLDKGILAGFDLGRIYPQHSNALLFCTTEIFSKNHLDTLVAEMRSQL